MIPLPTVETKPVPDCGECGGKCCRHITAPPFMLLWNADGTPEEQCRDWPDFGHWATVPNAMKAEYTYRRVNRVGRFDAEEPCHWLNDGRCGGYESRPQICRVFTPGGDHCDRARIGAVLVEPEDRDSIVEYAMSWGWIEITPWPWYKRRWSRAKYWIRRRIAWSIP